MMEILKTDQDAHRIAATLSEALPYLRRHAGSTFVVKYGGHVMGDDVHRLRFARDIVLLKQVGIHPVVVHGGGPQISAMLERLRIKTEMVDGLRVTDRETAEIVEMVLSGQINKQLVTDIARVGGRAVGLSGKDAGLFRAERMVRDVRDPHSNIETAVDYGYVGTPTDVDGRILEQFSQLDLIPVVAPVSASEAGETFNINADTVAGAIASALGAVRLYVLTDVAGVVDGNGELISHLLPEEAEHLIREGVVGGGMIPKVRMCIDAVRSGVGAAAILDGRFEHALLVEVFTAMGGGTLIGPPAKAGES